MLDKCDALPASEIARQFGEGFATKLGELQPGHWQGPVESSFGAHLVFISERTESGLPALAQVRDAVRRDRDDAQRLETNERLYQDLLKHYTVAVEGLQPTAAEKRIAAE